MFFGFDKHFTYFPHILIMEYNISDVIDLEYIQAYQLFGTVTFGLSVILEAFYAFIIYISVDKKLQFFRVLSFLYILCCILMEAMLLCWKPIKLLHFPVIYPVGLLSPMSSKTSAAFLGGIGLIIICFAELLTISIVERNFRILSIGNTNITKWRIATYVILSLTYFSGFIMIPMFAFVGIDDNRVRDLLETKVANSEKLFQGVACQ